MARENSSSLSGLHFQIILMRTCRGETDQVKTKQIVLSYNHLCHQGSFISGVVLVTNIMCKSHKHLKSNSGIPYSYVVMPIAYTSENPIKFKLK